MYYTPAYIVDYIVKHTVGRQIEGKSPAQLAGVCGTGVSPVKKHGPEARATQGRGGHATSQPFRVLDMACGSGSFLVGAYRCLLDHCLKGYIEHKPETHKRAVALAQRGEECVRRRAEELARRATAFLRSLTEEVA